MPCLPAFHFRFDHRICVGSRLPAIAAARTAARACNAMLGSQWRRAYREHVRALAVGRVIGRRTRGRPTLQPDLRLRLRAKVLVAFRQRRNSLRHLHATERPRLGPFLILDISAGGRLGGVHLLSPMETAELAPGRAHAARRQAGRQGRNGTPIRNGYRNLRLVPARFMLIMATMLDQMHSSASAPSVRCGRRYRLCRATALCCRRRPGRT